MPLDPSEYSVRDLRSELADIDAADELEAALAAEQDGDARVTAIDAIEGRLNAVREADEEPEDEPEPEPEPASYPAPDADDEVYFDPIGAGRGAETSHDTVHLLDDELEPRCGARVGNSGGVYPRSALAEGIDECSECPTA